MSGPAREPAAGPAVIAAIVEVTGIEEPIAARVARAIALTPDLATVADVTGVDPSVVRRVYAARRLITESPAGRPSAAPAARVLPGAQDGGTGASPTAKSTPRSRAERAVKPTASVYVPSDGDPRPRDGEGSGAFIRRMLVADAHTPEQIVGLVLSSFEGRKTTVKDVAWNHAKLLADGLDVPPWRGKTKPGSYPRQVTVAGTTTPEAAMRIAERDLRVGDVIESKRGAHVITGVATRPAARAASPLKRVAVVEWFPRVCGSVTFGNELSKVAPGLERVTFSRSGKRLAGWTSPWAWDAYPIRAAAEVLSRYDGVFLVDVACFAPEVNRAERPYYLDVISSIPVPYTGMFHGGLYPKKHDPALAAAISGSGFTGALLTTRLAQARERFASVGPARFVHHPYLPYDFSWADGRPTPRKIAAVTMTARIASNKGQNALLAAADALRCPAIVQGYNAFGLPSIAHRLVELGRALGYRLVDGPKLRRDKSALTHPNAPKFYTGAFEFETPSGTRYSYVDAYDRVEDADWSPWLHLSLPSRAFGDTLEYATLDAVAAGCVAIVPKTSVVEAEYRSLVTVPYEGCSLWSDEAGTGVRGADFDRAALVAAVNGYAAMKPKDLAAVAAAQRHELEAKHAADRVWGAVERAFRGEGS